MMGRRKGVEKPCQHCGTMFYRAPSLGKGMYCKRACADAAQTKTPRKETECPTCKKTFMAKFSLGKYQQYCSKKCWYGKGVNPKWKPCKTCGKDFYAKHDGHGKSPDGLKTYCSRACYAGDTSRGAVKHCKNCGKEFYLSKSTAEAKRGECCSLECRREHYLAEEAKAWKGGKYICEGGTREYVRKEDGRVTYIGSHRLVAAEAIGRPLRRYENILRIDGDKMNTSPDNLFICGSISEMRKRYNGALPWPKESNLDTYEKVSPNNTAQGEE